MTIKLAASSMLAPGENPMQQLAFLRNCGFDGMELRLKVPDGELPDYLNDLQRAIDATGLRICSLIMPDPAFALPFDGRQSMEAKLSSLVRNLHIAGPLGAVSLFCPEYLPQQPLPLWNPPKPMTSVEQELLVELLSRATEVAEQVGGMVVLEAINRYETHLVQTLDTAYRLCQLVNSPRVGLLADFFHMNIEEADFEASLLGVAGSLRHVQLGDSNRLLPGQGHLDFRPGLRALSHSHYDGFLALECQAGGPPEITLPHTVDFLRRQLAACFEAELAVTA